jgi:uncharacterized protein YutE (UPF0331/DUF86 family)
MVISNLNTKLLEDRLGSINGALAKLKNLSLLPENDFLKNDKPAAAESYLRRSLESAFDIGRHIVARTAGKGEVEYKEIAHRLHEIGVISGELSERLKLMAGYRNRLVHFYHEITEKELYFIIKNDLQDIERFVKEIKTFIEHYNKRHDKK